MSSLILSAYDLLRSLKSPEEARHASRVICTPCNLPDTETEPRESRPPRPSVRPSSAGDSSGHSHSPPSVRPTSKVQGPRPKAPRAADPRSTYLPSVQCAHCTEYGGRRRAPSTPTPVPEFHIPHTCMRKRDIWRRRPEGGGGPIPEPRVREPAPHCNWMQLSILSVSSVQRAMCNVQCAVQSRNTYLEKVAVRGAMYGVLILITEACLNHGATHGCARCDTVPVGAQDGTYQRSWPFLGAASPSLEGRLVSYTVST